MSGLYIVGGQQRRARALLEGEPGWYKYRRGIVLQVDPIAGLVECRADYVSPPELCAVDEPAILFKCGTLQDGKLYVCTQTEVLIFAVPDFTLLTHISLPCFNDLHHVRPMPSGTLLIANSGLDMVLEITIDGQILREWNTLGEGPWARFDRKIDYRRVASTKPHRSHPNQVFLIGDEIWATRFEQRDAICLTDPSKRIQIGTGLVHDGLVHDGFIYFTTVTGTIVIVNARTLMIEEVIDLNLISSPDAILGWCRGILVEDGKAWVGFSRLRLTKFRENVSWVRWGFKQHLPTRVVCYDLTRRAHVAGIELQSHGLDAVFSIFSAETSLSRVSSPESLDAALEPDTVIAAGSAES